MFEVQETSDTLGSWRRDIEHDDGEVGDGEHGDGHDDDKSSLVINLEHHLMCSEDVENQTLA